MNSPLFGQTLKEPFGGTILSSENATINYLNFTIFVALQITQYMAKNYVISCLFQININKASLPGYLKLALQAFNNVNTNEIIFFAHAHRQLKKHTYLHKTLE